MIDTPASDAEAPPTSRQVARGAGTAMLARAGAMIEIVSQPLYVWLFGLPTYGLYMVLWSAVNLAENIFDLGMTAALQRVVPQARDDAERAIALRTAMLGALVPCLLVALAASLLARPLSGLVNVAARDQARLVTGIALFAWTLPLWAFIEVATSALRARKAFGPEIRLRILWEQVIRMLAAIALWAAGASTLGLLIAHLCSLAITCFFSVRLLSRHYRLGLVFSLPFAGPIPRQTLFAGLSVLPTNIVNRLFSDAPPLVLNMMIPGAAGASASGLFAIARKIASIVQLIRQAFSYVMAPLASEAIRHDKRHVAEIYGYATRLTLVAATPIVVTIIGCGTAILAFFGHNAQAAFWTLVLLTFTRMIEAIAGQSGSIQQVMSRYHHPMVGSAIGLAVAVGLGLLLLPEGGIDGMAIAVAAGIIITTITPMVQLWLSEHIHPFAPPFGRAAASTILVGLVLLAADIAISPLPHVPRLIAGIVLLLAGIWCSARFGLPHADRLTLGKTARRLRLV